MDRARNQLLTWCEVDLAAIRRNLRTFRELLPPAAGILFVVKANAYGHGLELLAAEAASLGADWLGVHQVDEAAAARRAGWSGPLLVMGYTPQALLPEAAGLDLDFTVYDGATIHALEALGRARARPIRCHLKVETGTYRQGIALEELPHYLDLFARSPGVALHALSMHFANIEDTTDHSYAMAQLARFREFLDQAATRGLRLHPHAACSAAVLVFPGETAFALARVGIGAYGIWPSRETLASTAARTGQPVRLHPALTWKTRVAEVKSIPAGAAVGYGGSHRTTRPTRLVVLPVGYSDGYDRRLSNLADVLIRGRRAPVLGRVCMNMIMADATDHPAVEVEDEVVLLGRQGDEEIRAADLASIAQTIPYEIVSRISPSIPRVTPDQRIVAPGGSSRSG